MTDSPAAAARKPRPGLGRGLSALLGESLPEEPIKGNPTSSSGVRMLPISSLVAEENPPSPSPGRY